MKSQHLVWAGIACVAVAALAVFQPVVLWVTMGFAAAAFGLYWVSRCRHGGQLGLLPPTVDEDGTRTPARWYCDACGKTWPAGLESDRSPIVRFTGYDESKLPASAKRAEALAKQRHALAVKRAGLVTTRAKAEERPAPATARITSINERRAAR